MLMENVTGSRPETFSDMLQDNNLKITNFSNSVKHKDIVYYIEIAKDVKVDFNEFKVYLMILGIWHIYHVKILFKPACVLLKTNNRVFGRDFTNGIRFLTLHMALLCANLEKVGTIVFTQEIVNTIKKV